MQNELTTVVNKHIARVMVESCAKAVGPFDEDLAQRVLDILSTSNSSTSSAPEVENTPPRAKKGKAAAASAEAGPSGTAGVCGVKHARGECGGALDAEGHCKKCAAREYNKKWAAAKGKK